MHVRPLHCSGAAKQSSSSPNPRDVSYEMGWTSESIVQLLSRSTPIRAAIVLLQNANGNTNSVTLGT